MNGYKPIVNVQNLNPAVESSHSSVGPHQKTVNSDGGVVYKDVVIIGAGCAGVECASKLYSCGFENILLLEAQDYIGGRIKTVYVDEIDNQFPLEMGANWIHGYLGNPLYKLVLENPELFQHKKKFLFETITAVCADARTGRVVDTALCERLWLDYLDWNAEAKNYWESRQKSDYKNYAQFIMDRLETQMNELGDDAETRKLKIAIMTRLLKQETIESGCSSMSLCSLNEYGSYSKPIGPDYEFPGGYSKMIQFLAKRLPESSIKVCHAVKHLRLLDHDAVDDCRNVSPSKSSPPKCRNQSHSIEIECTNGFRVRAKHVVVTCSLNYLKHSYKSMFDPRLLTPSKVEAIETVKMGVVDKIFLLYDDLASFWPEGVNAVHPIFLDGESGQLVTDNNGLAKAICQDDETDVHKPTTPWYRKVFTFDRFYDNLLLVWITGWQAEVAEKLPNEEISRTLTDLLRRTLSNPRVPEPKKVIKTTWSSNPYVMGSYSYVDVNGSALTHINNLAEPVFINKIPRVLFAGEATHLRYYSTVHGAYLSGQREARRLLEFYSTVSRL